ncbi:hypothetical protein QDR37_07405 [Amnibacterium sp. CER49]|uniref:hypothetical protein n=1 Tax=Amnibacterium sp. CER49 TaxID=3039161 RepID=UPI00244BF0D3|nr:hypothetical protein [Amnibacterium sp. CER49]MDH2443768.1 hypothetical protein [Amnibacterium sp. CER49]
MAGTDRRQAARAHAAEQRRQEQRRRARRRGITIAAIVAAAVAVLGGGTAAIVAATASPAANADGRTSPPPWSAPADVEARVKAAGLGMLTAEGTALHIHQHLTVTVDGKAVQVPAFIGIDEQAQRISAVHTHDASGIIHVESPEVRTFHLDQVFAEWDVRLAKHAIGPYVDGKDGATLTVFVNQHRYTGDPRSIALTGHEDIDLVVTHGAATPQPPAKFVWPKGL